MLCKSFFIIIFILMWDGQHCGGVVLCCYVRYRNLAGFQTSLVYHNESATDLLPL